MAQSLKQRVDQHDREVAAIRKLILTGMKMINEVAAAQKRAEKRADRTEERLDRLERKWEDFINSLKRGSNGHPKRFTDVQ